MTKAELISAMASEAKITKAAAATAIDCITDAITKNLKKGGRITLTGFGTFSVAKRRQGRGEIRRQVRSFGSPVQARQGPEGGGEVKRQRSAFLC